MNLLFNLQHPGFKIENDRFKVEDCAGTLIRATMRPADLVPLFMNAIKYTPEYEQLVANPFSPVPSEAFENDSHPFWETEEAQEFLVELFIILDDYAPEGYYFGATEGDGSDYGYWTFKEEWED